MSTADLVAALLGDRTPPDRDARARLFADMLLCFPAFNLRVIGTLRGALVVQFAKHPVGDMWMVSDNGGELNVARINDRRPLRSEPYTGFGEILDGATVAYRVRCAIDGDAVDYTARLADALDVLRAEAA